MQEEHGQNNHAFGKLVGEWLTDGVAAQQTTEQQHAVRELGGYLRTVRTFHGRAAAALANELGLATDELHALEQGLLPRQHLTAAFLQKIARAYQEDATLLQALLDATQHRFAQPALHPRAPQQAASTDCPVPATDSGGFTVEPVLHSLHRWWLFFATECRQQIRQLREQVALPEWGGMNVHSLQPVLLAVLVIVLGYAYLRIDNAAVAARWGVQAERVATAVVRPPSTVAAAGQAAASRSVGDPIIYQIVSRQEWEHTTSLLPAIPIQDDQIALLGVRQVVPKIVKRCHIIGHQDSCPM